MIMNLSSLVSLHPDKISQIFKTLHHNVTCIQQQHCKLSSVMENINLLKITSVSC